MKFHSRILNDDFILEDDLHITGETTAFGSIQVFSLISEKALTVNEDLVTTKGSIYAKDSLKIGNDLISSKNITAKGRCEIKGNVQGKNVQLTGKSVKAYSIEGENIDLSGEIEVKKDVTASESVEISINPKKKSPRITGVVTAPIVTITFVGLFTKWFLLPDTILNKLRMRIQMKKVFIIKNLSIQAIELLIRSNFPPDRVDVQFIDSNIDVSEIKFV